MLIRSSWLLLAVAVISFCSAPADGIHIHSSEPHLAFGQAPDKSGAWVVHGPRYSLRIDGRGASLVSGAKGQGLQLKFLGAASRSMAVPSDPQEAHVSYLIGNDPKQWLKDQVTYGRVRYDSVYPKTDLAWYGSEGRLEYDLILRPGSDVKAIRLQLEGTDRTALENGALRLHVPGGSVQLRAPIAYQDGERGREPVAVRYELLANGGIGFRLGAYDASRTLTDRSGTDLCKLLRGECFDGGGWDRHGGECVCSSASRVDAGCNESAIPVRDSTGDFQIRSGRDAGALDVCGPRERHLVSDGCRN